MLYNSCGAFGDFCSSPLGDNPKGEAAKDLLAKFLFAKSG